MALLDAALIRVGQESDKDSEQAVRSLTHAAPTSLWCLLTGSEKGYLEKESITEDHFSAFRRVLKAGTLKDTGTREQRFENGGPSHAAPASPQHSLALQVETDRRCIDITLPLVDVWLCYLPLALYLSARACDSTSRLLVGIAGCAAAGKTTLSMALQQILGALDCM